ncbi:MAG: hypothetical protein OQK82_04660 [Candidatus Pacearchaeota archaeon]|nr:hypothetical protein [Candidatus Pacearchaeota archaeon]
MVIKEFLSGFFVKAVTGFDDTMVHIPIVANLTKTRLGKIAFSLGIVFAICVAIGISFLFSSVIRLIPYHNYVASGLLLFIACSVYFEWFIEQPKKKSKEKLKKRKRISSRRFFKLVLFGFLTAIATVIDDTIAYSTVFIHAVNPLLPIAGIFSMTLLEIFVIIRFSRQVSRIKYKKEITAIGLVILSVLVFIGIF